MRRAILIVTGGVVVAALVYWCVFQMGTSSTRSMVTDPKPELAWLRREFQLGDAEFQRIAQLHAAYLPQCEERCRRIERLNVSLTAALATSTQLSPAIESLLKERADLRVVCQTEMLRHLFEVSRTMQPEAGKRYLAWAREHTCLHEQPMGHGEMGRGSMGDAMNGP